MTLKRRSGLTGAVLIAVLLPVAACGSKVSSTASGPITERAIAAVALEHLSDRTKAREGLYTDETSLPGLIGADLRYDNGDQQSDGALIRVTVQPAGPEEAACDGDRPCAEMSADEGTLVLRWDVGHPEQEPGLFSLNLYRDDQLIRVSAAGPLILGDPRDQDLPVSVDDLAGLVQDPRLGLETDGDTIESGSRLKDWDGDDAGTDHLAVPATDRSTAVSYLALDGGSVEYTQRRYARIEPSPLRSEFGSRSVGARLTAGSRGPVGAVTDVIVTAQLPRRLDNGLCGPEGLAEQCAEQAGFFGPIALKMAWTPATASDPGVLWVVQVETDRTLVVRFRGPEIPQTLASINRHRGWPPAVLSHSYVELAVVGLVTRQGNAAFDLKSWQG